MCPAHLPGLTVWPKVIWGTLAGVAVGGAGLSGARGLVLTWVQVTHISTVVTIVTWDQKDRRGSVPTRPQHFLYPSPSTVSIIPALALQCRRLRLRDVM